MAQYNKPRIYYPINSDNSDDNELDLEMMCSLAANPSKREGLKIIKGTNTYLNSLNVFVGRQRTGKSYTATREIIKICRNHPETHLIVYINQTGQPSDDTFENTKELIERPIVYVAYEQCEKFLRELLSYKDTYNKIKDHHAETTVPHELINELCDKLYIEDLSLPYLHTIIMLEDATNTATLKKGTSYINELMTQCRHIQASFFVIIHFWKALSTNLKSNLSTIYIYSGYSRQQLQYILSQMNISKTIKEVYDEYRTLGLHDKLMIDSNRCISKVIK